MGETKSISKFFDSELSRKQSSSSYVYKFSKRSLIASYSTVDTTVRQAVGGLCLRNFAHLTGESSAKIKDHPKNEEKLIYPF